MTQLAAVLTAIEDAKREAAAEMKAAIVERVREKADLLINEATARPMNDWVETWKDRAETLYALATELEKIELTQDSKSEDLEVK